MKRHLIIAAMTMLSAIAPAHAGNDGAGAENAAGRVESVMVRDAHEAWVKVWLPANRARGSRSDLFQVPEDVTLERGDIVMVQTAGHGLDNPAAGGNRITSVLARHDTLYAMLFEISVGGARGSYKLPNGAEGFEPVVFNPAE